MKCIIKDLSGPAHTGEFDFGFSMESREGKWFWIIDSAYATPGSSTSYTHEEFELSEDFFVGLTWKNFAEKLSEEAPRSYAPSWIFLYPKDRDAIEALFR